VMAQTAHMESCIAGEVGYLSSNKAVADARVGDTITLSVSESA